MASLKRVSRYSLAIFLSLLLALTPLSPLMKVAPLAPVTAAQAATPEEDLKACLNTISAAGKLADAAVDAAKSIAEALSNPDFVACTAEAASLNVVTIAFMAAITAYWASDTNAFDSPQSCQAALVDKVLQAIATGLSEAIEGIDLVRSILEGLIGKTGIDLIFTIANGVADLEGTVGGVFDKAKEKVGDALARVEAEAKAKIDNLAILAQSKIDQLTQQLNDQIAALGPNAAHSQINQLTAEIEAQKDAINKEFENAKKAIEDQLAKTKAEIQAYADGQIDAAKAEAQKQAKQEVIDKALEGLAKLLGPMMHYLNCGCVAAGTAAIIKNAGEAVAAAGGQAADGVESCWELLKDPKALISAVFSDPIGTLKVFGEAVCGAVAEVVDVCGAAKAICEASGLCAAGELLADAGAWLNCHLNPWADCDPPPTPAALPPCQPGALFQTASAMTQACTCGGGKGAQFWAGTPPGSSEYKTGWTCDTCTAPTTGLDAFGQCTLCALGFQQDPKTGRCDLPITCGAGERINTATNSCFSCAAGQTYNEAGNGCITDCTGKEPLVYKASQFGPGVCACPKGNQVWNNGTCEQKVSCDKSQGLEYDIFTNSCRPMCKDNEIAERPLVIAIDKLDGKTNVGEWTCKPCEDGKVAEGNACVTACAAGSVRADDGTCMACAEGTSQDGNSCSPVCPAGYAFVKGSGGRATSARTPAGRSAGLLAVHAAAGRNSLSGNISLNPNSIVGASQGLPDGGLCKPCGENERSVTQTIAGEKYAITTSACAPCPKGTTSKPGSDRCEPMSFSVVGIDRDTRASGASVSGAAAAAGAAAAGAVLRGIDRGKDKDDGQGRRGAAPVKADEKGKSRPRRPATGDDADDGRLKKIGRTTVRDPGDRTSEDPKAPHIRTPKKQGPVETKTRPKSRAPDLDDIGTGVSVGSRGGPPGNPSAKGGGGSTGPSFGTGGSYIAPQNRR